MTILLSLCVKMICHLRIIMSPEELLQKVAAGQMSVEEASGLMKRSSEKQIHYKVTPKGAIGFYGIRRMPIVLYQQELYAIMKEAQTEEFKKFVEDNDGCLSKK